MAEKPKEFISRLTSWVKRLVVIQEEWAKQSGITLPARAEDECK